MAARVAPAPIAQQALPVELVRKKPLSELIHQSRGGLPTSDIFFNICLALRYWLYNFVVTTIAVFYPSVLRRHTDCPQLELVKVLGAEPEVVRILVYETDNFAVRLTNLLTLGLRSTAERAPKLDVAVYSAHLDYCVTAALARDMVPDPDALIKTVRLSLTSKPQPECMARSVMAISVATGTISTVLRQRLRRWYVEGVQSVCPATRKSEFTTDSLDRRIDDGNTVYWYLTAPAFCAYWHGNGMYYVFYFMHLFLVELPLRLWNPLVWLVHQSTFWYLLGIYLVFVLWMDYVLIPMYRTDEDRARRYLEEYLVGVANTPNEETTIPVGNVAAVVQTTNPSVDDAKTEDLVEPPLTLSLKDVYKAERESLYTRDGLLSAIDEYTPMQIHIDPKLRRTYTVPPSEIDIDLNIHTDVYDSKFRDLVDLHWGSEDLMSYSSYLSTTAYIGPVNDEKPNLKVGKVDYNGITSLLDVADAPKVDPKLASYSRNRTEDSKQDSKFTHYGPMYLGRLPSMFNNNAHNESIALAHRHCLPAPSGTLNVALWKMAKRSLGNSFDLKKLVDLYWGDGPSIDNWLSTMDNKKAQPLREFLENPYDFTEADYRRNSFIKADMQLPKAGGRLEGEAPRLIQALKKQQTNVYLGPFMSHLSKVIAKPLLDYPFFDTADFVGLALADELPQCLYSSGSDSLRIGQWYDFHVSQGRKFLENDFSRFDSTQGEGASLIEHLYYEETGHLNDNIKIALKAQTRTSGDGKYHRYKVNWTRKSGDQNTSVGNTLINITALGGALNAFKGIKRLDPKFKDFRWWMIALGDDNTIAYEGCADEDIPVLVKYVENFLTNLGLKPKLSACKVPSYLSAFFVPCEVRDGKAEPFETHVLMPNLVDHLSKMGVTTGVMTDCAVGRMKGNLGGLGNTRLMPIVRVFHNYYNSRDEKANTSGAWANQHHQLTTAEVRPTDKTFEWYERTYGVCEREINDLESFLTSHLESTRGLASFWLHPTMEKMIATLRSNRS